MKTEKNHHGFLLRINRTLQTKGTEDCLHQSFKIVIVRKYTMQMTIFCNLKKDKKKDTDLTLCLRLPPTRGQT